MDTPSVWGTGMCRPSGCTFLGLVFSQGIFFCQFFLSVFSQVCCSTSVSYMFPGGIQYHAFWLYFMFSQAQGQLVLAAQPRQSWYLSPPPPSDGTVKPQSVICAKLIYWRISLGQIIDFLAESGRNFALQTFKSVFSLSPGYANIDEITIRWKP